MCYVIYFEIHIAHFYRVKVYIIILDMKRFFGWFLIICGILSLPGLLPKLSRVHSGYEVIGILLGLIRHFE